MRRLIGFIGILTGILAATVAPLHAQGTAPEYTAFSIARLLSEDGTQVEAEFLVSNVGGDATEPATVELSELGSDVALAASEVPPLAAGETYELLMSFPVRAFADVEPETENVVFELVITSTEFSTIRRLAEFTIPAVPDDLQPPAQSEQPVQPQPTTPDTTGNATEPATNPLQDIIEQAQVQVDAATEALPFDLNLSEPVQLAGALAALLVAIIVIWLVVVLFRLLFIPRPTFPQNPPPYLGMPQMHPDSIPGRRQMWQQVAQNSSMMAENTEGNLHARKIITDTAGNRFSGWKVVGMRASQYDTYGRVTRTQVIAPNRVLRRLSNTLNRAETLPEKAVRRRVRPAANYMVRQLNRRINKRGAALPIALDVKFRGEHGEVNIRFELYQFQLGAWRELDRWQPEMTVPGKFIYEAFTYTIHGLHTNESMREFRLRLRADVTYLLAEMVLS
ncbi:MAG: hypothetical protein AAFV33_19265, partial [Chloroflexota bacterium]